VSVVWLVVTFLAMIVAISAFVSLKRQRERYKLGLLTLMLTGTFLLVLVDHVMAFIRKGTFIQVTTDGLITNGIVLGLVMLLPVLLVWILAIYLPKIIRRRDVL